MKLRNGKKKIIALHVEHLMDKINLSFLGTSLGYSISLFLIPLMVMDITSSSLMVSITYALDILPYILFTPFIGWIGDRYNKKKVILVGEFLCFIMSLILLLTPLKIEFVYVLMIIGFIISSSSALHHSIFQSAIPILYPKDELHTANSNIAIISNITGVISPSIISIFLYFSFFSEKSVVIVVVFSYILSFFAFLNVEYNESRNKIKHSIYKSFLNGWGFIKSNKELKYFSYLFFFANFGLKMVFVNLIWIYSYVFGLKNNEISLNFIFIGLCSVLGAKIAGKYIVNKIECKKIIMASLFFISIATLCIPFKRNDAYLTFLWGIVSLLSMFIVVAYFTFRQKVTPPEILGSVVSITRLISYLAIPPSALISGFLIQKYGNENIIYVISGGVMFLSCVFFVIPLIFTTSHKQK